MTTQIYVNLERMLFSGPTDEYMIKVAETLDEAINLMQAGFEFHVEMEGRKLFRTRK